MYEVLDHKDRAFNALITIEAEDQQPTGVSAFYTLRVEEPAGSLTISLPFYEPWNNSRPHRGITEESLLAVLVDRLRGQQLGPLANAATGRALAHLQRALHALKQKPCIAAPSPAAPE